MRWWGWKFKPISRTQVANPYVTSVDRPGSRKRGHRVNIHVRTTPRRTPPCPLRSVCPPCVSREGERKEPERRGGEVVSGPLTPNRVEKRTGPRRYETHIEILKRFNRVYKLETFCFKSFYTSNKNKRKPGVPNGLCDSGRPRWRFIPFFPCLG